MYALPFGAQRRSRRLRVLQTRNGGHRKALMARRGPQGPARFPSPSCLLLLPLEGNRCWMRKEFNLSRGEQVFGEAGVNHKLIRGLGVIIVHLCNYHIFLTYLSQIGLLCITTRVTQPPDLPEIVYSCCPGQHLSGFLTSNSAGL